MIILLNKDNLLDFIVLLFVMFSSYFFNKQISRSINNKQISRSILSLFPSFNYKQSKKHISIIKPNIRSFSLLLLSTNLKSTIASMSLSSSSMASSSCIAPSKISGPIEYFRNDYLPSNYLISDVYLDFKLSAKETIVISKSTINPIDNNADLILDGEELTLLSLSINGKDISNEFYCYNDEKLTIFSSVIPKSNESFELITQVRIHPDTNLALTGLYSSGSNLLCTQCEAMGFRRIVFHLDRPDVLSKYTVRLEGNKNKYPLLLSNGNNIESGDTTDGNHYSIWFDPFPKPSYLFALVAGDLGSIHDEYVTTSGRIVKLGIYTDKENVGKLAHAMYSIKRSMKWDEDTFGLECDLDIYNIVATNDFNMGAMENKGLNIFNSAYILADSKTATDIDYDRILGVIGHEYFHNWSGNRVTVRDWFQLTLKEGLTVFRDQWFTSDVSSKIVKRIEDVRILRGKQFPEDQGPMSHPIRPESYISMDNFYTGTVYMKGAEVVRMYRTLLGEAGFKAGLKLYFSRHDGTAVTCDDFRFAMADANNIDLSQFERWYTQAGTPIINVSQRYDKIKKTFKLTFKQHIPSTPGQLQEEKLPLLIPIVIGLLGKDGKEILPDTVLKLNQPEQFYIFQNILEEPIPSILRDFSAPVKIQMEKPSSEEELAFLMSYDTDSFNKWDAGNRLSSQLILSLAELTIDEIKEIKLSSSYINAFKTILTSCSESTSDYSLVAYSLQLPDITTLSQDMEIIDFNKLHNAREHVKKELYRELKQEFEIVYAETSDNGKEYVFNSNEVGRRMLHNTCLGYITSLGDISSISYANEQYSTANCMTDKLAALSSLASIDCIETKSALDSFYKQANGDALVLNKWFSIQAMADLPDVLNRVKMLKSHPDFSITNPNRARSLISVFAANVPHFNNKDGSGYQFIADCVIELDALNPQVAARLAQVFSQWKKLDINRKNIIKIELDKILDSKLLSKDTMEVISRIRG